MINNLQEELKLSQELITVCKAQGNLKVALGALIIALGALTTAAKIPPASMQQVIIDTYNEVTDTLNTIQETQSLNFN